MKDNIKVFFVSLGCPKNQLDTEVMLRELYDEGIEIVSEDFEADVVVVNTCAFIESAKQESIDNIIDIGCEEEPVAQGHCRDRMSRGALPRHHIRRAPGG